VRYALSSVGEIFVDLPYKAEVLRVDEEDEHHRNETLRGVSDLRLGGKYYPIFTPRLQVAVTLGVVLPTGFRNPTTRLSYVSHEEAEDLGLTLSEHSHLQLGTGTFAPFGGVESLFRLDKRWILFGTLSTLRPLYPAEDGYRTASVTNFLIGPGVFLNQNRLIISLFADVSRVGRDHLSGENVVTEEGTLSGELEVPNTGRSELAASLAVTCRFTKALSMALRLRAPFYTRIDEEADQSDIQLTEPMGVGINLSYDFDLRGDAH